MKLIHYSQQFHRTPEVLNRAVTDILSAVTEPEVLTLTEVGTRDRAGVLPRDGFTVTQNTEFGRAADCAIITRDSVYTVLASEAWQVTDIPYLSMPGRLVHGWWAVGAVIRDNTDGTKVLVTAGHPLAHLVSPLRKRIHREGCIGWAANIKSLAAKHGVERVVVVADWNLNLKRAGSIKYLEDIFGAGFKVAAPDVATHDSRVIDGAVIKGFKSKWARTMPKTRASDHAPVAFFLEKTAVPDPEPKPPSPPYVGPARHHGGKTNKPINRLVIHATTGKCEPGAARGTAKYFRETTRDASAHYVTDPDESVQVVYDSWVAYHAPPNEHSLGFELCFNPTRGPIGFWLLPNPRKMLKGAARLVAEAAVYYDVPVVKLDAADLLSGKRGICGHDDVSEAWHQTSHWDPGWFPWKSFLKKVNREAENVRAGR